MLIQTPQEQEVDCIRWRELAKERTGQQVLEPKMMLVTHIDVSLDNFVVVGLLLDISQVIDDELRGSRTAIVLPAMVAFACMLSDLIKGRFLGWRKLKTDFNIK